MTKYHKIPGPYKRQEHKPYDVLEGMWTTPEIEFLSEVDWNWTEKVDGTNIRIIWDGHNVSFAGRTDRAEIPPKLLAHLEDTFSAPGVEEVFEQSFGGTPAVMYGEGYGGKIQKGGKYHPDESFIAFDVRVGDWWLLRPDVEEIAETFGVEVVPLVMTGPVQHAIDAVRRGDNHSFWGDFQAEGLVGTPVVPLFDRKGHRIIVKIKAADFPHGMPE